MEKVINGIKSAYFQFVSFLQDMHIGVFATIWLALLALTLVNMMKFYKAYDGTQKEFVKMNKLILAIIFFACLVFLTYVRK